MPPKIFLRSREGRRQIATWRGDRLVAYEVVDASRPERTDSVYLGRVKSVDRSLGAAFVEFSPGEEGLLPLRGGRRPAEGSSLLVQLRRERQGSKAARLADRITLTDRDLHLQIGGSAVEIYPQMTRTAQTDAVRKAVADLLPSGFGASLRPSSDKADLAQMECQVRRLLDAWKSICDLSASAGPPRLIRPAEDALDRALRDLPKEGAEITCADRTTAHLVARRLECEEHVGPAVTVLPESQWMPSVMELDEAVEDALSDEVALPGGGSLLFEPGRTLVAVDVNSGEFSSTRGQRASPDQVRLALNKAAATEIALQLRLRNLSGPIVIDFISMRRKSEQDQVVDALRSACCADSRPCEVLPMSRFGLVEMVRQGRGLALADQLRRAPS